MKYSMTKEAMNRLNSLIKMTVMDKEFIHTHKFYYKGEEYVAVFNCTYDEVISIISNIYGTDIHRYSNYYHSIGEQPIWYVFSPKAIKGFSVRTEAPWC